MTKGISKNYEFGAFHLDVDSCCVVREGKPVELSENGYGLLLALVERHGQLVSREELLKLVWGDADVDDSNLAVNISALRKTLGTRIDGGQFIETIPRRGYRFAATLYGVQL